jgi:hypothetical protein
MKSSTVSAASLFLCLTWILSPAGVSGQTLAPIRKLPLNEPLEKYNNPFLENSSRMEAAARSVVSYQANVDANGNNILRMPRTSPLFLLILTNAMIGRRQLIV